MTKQNGTIQNFTNCMPIKWIITTTQMQCSFLTLCVCAKKKIEWAKWTNKWINKKKNEIVTIKKMKHTNFMLIFPKRETRKKYKWKCIVCVFWLATSKWCPSCCPDYYKCTENKRRRWRWWRLWLDSKYNDSVQEKY